MGSKGVLHLNQPQFLVCVKGWCACWAILTKLAIERMNIFVSPNTLVKTRICQELLDELALKFAHKFKVLRA